MWDHHEVRHSHVLSTELQIQQRTRVEQSSHDYCQLANLNQLTARFQAWLINARDYCVFEVLMPTYSLSSNYYMAWINTTTVSPFLSIVWAWNSVALRPAKLVWRGEYCTSHTTQGLISRAISAEALGKKRAVRHSRNVRDFKFPLKFEIAHWNLKYENIGATVQPGPRSIFTGFTDTIPCLYLRSTIYCFSGTIPQLNCPSIVSNSFTNFLPLFIVCFSSVSIVFGASDVLVQYIRNLQCEQTYRLCIDRGITVIHRCDGVHCNQTLDCPKRLASFFVVVVMGVSQQVSSFKP